MLITGMSSSQLPLGPLTLTHLNHGDSVENGSLHGPIRWREGGICPLSATL